MGVALLEEWRRNGGSWRRTQKEMAASHGVHLLTLRHALAWLEKTGRLRADATGFRKTRRTKPNRIGFPLWIRCMAELDAAHVSARLNTAHHIHSELTRHGYSLDIRCVGLPHAPNMDKITALMGEWQALILEPMEGESALEADHPFAAMKNFTVAIGALQGMKQNCVRADYYTGGQLAVDELVRLGAKKILYTGRSQEHASHQFLRLAAAEAAVDRHPGVQLVCAEGGFFAEEVFSAVKRFFLEGGGCDAVLATTSYGFLGAMRALTDLGLEVPRDVQVISLGRPMLSAYMTPRPTAVVVQRGRVGREVARMALHLAHTDGSPIPTMLLPMELVQGETTRGLVRHPATTHVESARQAAEEALH